MKKALLAAMAAVAASIAIAPNVAPTGPQAGGNQVQTQQGGNGGGAGVNQSQTPADGAGNTGSSQSTVPFQPRVLPGGFGEVLRTYNPYSFLGRKPYRPQRGSKNTFSRKFHGRHVRRKARKA